MINEITVTDLSKAVSLSYQDTIYNAWISTVDFQDEPKINSIKKNLRLKRALTMVRYFYDWSDEDGIEDNHIKENIEFSGPQKQDVEDIINFIKCLQGSENVYNLGINCYAGVSRSTAVAIIAFVIKGLYIEAALENVLVIRPYAWPNLRILRFASEILCRDLKSHVESWKKKQEGKIVTW